MTRRISFAGVAWTVSLCMATTAFGQGVSMHVTNVSIGHYLLDNPLAGGGVSFESRTRARRVMIRFGADHVVGSSDRVASPCFDVILPGGCAPVPMRDKGRFTMGTAGLVLALAGNGRVGVEATGDLHGAYVNVDTRGAATDYHMRASKALWGASIGAGAFWMPFKRFPAALDVRVSTGGLIQVVPIHTADGYTPFEQGMHFTRMSAGIAWRALPR